MKRFLQDKFLRQTAIFFTGTMIGSFLSYLFHPVLGRVMSLEDFGELEAVISMTLQFGIITGVFSSLVMNIVTNSHNDDPKKVATLLHQLQTICLIIMTVVFLLTVIFAGFMQKTLKFSSPWPFVGLGVIMVSGVFFTFRNAWLQGKQDFSAVSLANIIGSGARLVFAAILVVLGFKTLGAVVGLILAGLASLWYVWVKTRDFKNSEKMFDFSGWSRQLVAKGAKYGLLIFMASGCITFLYTFDVIAVKYFFSAQDAGVYGGVATIARIIFFVTAAVGGVLFPAIKLKNTFAENSKILLKGLALTGVLGGVTLLTFSLFPSMVIRIMIGSKYLPLANLMPILGSLIFLVSLANILVMFFMALRKFSLIYLSIPPIILSFALAFFYHDSIYQIILDFMGGAVLLNIILLTLYGKNYFHYRSHLQRGQESPIA
ncbi:MAG: oligosaccharide flippase family protein [Patescibacteria group bacterium]